VPVAGLASRDPGLAIAFVRRQQRIGDSATAADVAQRALERAWRHAPVHDSRRSSIRA
jgi:DNA-directed RNA polymerase specialized sigma24 family protein